MDLYKIVGPNGEPLNGGSGDWPLPCQHAASPVYDGCARPDHVRAGDGWGAPGDWRDVDGPLEACRNGLHLADASQIPHWLPSHGAFVIYRAETRGPIINAGDKYVAGSVRLLPRERPMPDMLAARAKRQAATDKARDAAARREKRAKKLLDVAIPAVWQRYLSDASTLPAGHPGRVYQDAMRDARAAYDAAVDMPRYRAAVGRADAEYTRTLTGGVMPD